MIYTNRLTHNNWILNKFVVINKSIMKTTTKTFFLESLNYSYFSFAPSTLVD